MNGPTNIEDPAYVLGMSVVAGEMARTVCLDRVLKLNKENVHLMMKILSTAMFVINSSMVFKSFTHLHAYAKFLKKEDNSQHEFHA